MIRLDSTNDQSAVSRGMALIVSGLLVWQYYRLQERKTHTQDLK